MKKIISSTPFILVSITIIYLSLKTPTGEPPQFENIDKLYHFIAYGALGFFTGLAFSKGRILWLFLGFGLLLGVTLEYIQGLLPYRDMSAADGIANILGLFAGYFAFNRLQGLLNE